MISKFLSYFGYTKNAASTTDRSGWFVDWARGGMTTVSGERINNDSALTLSTVFACINNISTDVAKLPIKVYRKQRGQRDEIDDHPLRYLLDKQPNAEMTAMDYRQAETAHCVGWGNGYSEIVRNTNGTVAYLLPLKPSNMRLYRDDAGYLFYKYRTDDNQERDILAGDVLHIHGMGFDGLQGYNVIQYARESMGLAKATEKFGAAYFGNGCAMGGWLEHPGNLSEAAQKNLISSIEKRNQGAVNSHKINVAEEGMKFKEATIPPEESQFLETRQFSIPEVCRWFRMPPHKVADLTRATFSNIEEQSLEYVTDTLTPWLRRWEQAIWSKLLTQQEREDGFYVEHVTEALLKGNIQARYQAYQIAIGNNNNPGFMTINEIRSRENLNPMNDGDELFTPQADTSTEPDMNDAVINDMSARIFNREQQELENARRIHGEKFDVDKFMESFTKKQVSYIESVTKPLCIELDANQLIGKSQEEIKEILCSLKYSIA